MEHGCTTRLVAAAPEDEAFLFGVASTTWEHAVAAMPDPRIVRHFLRIQYTSQEARLQARFPQLLRYVVTGSSGPVGRLYLHDTPTLVTIVDMTLLPEFRSLGIGTALLEGVLTEAAEHKQAVNLRVSRHNARAANLYETSGFRLVAVDDLDNFYEWTPSPRTHLTAAGA